MSDPKNRLAQIRTDLANERTLLAYGRTSLMMAASGATVIKFFGDSRELYFTGIALIVLGGMIGTIGIARFRSNRAEIAKEGE